MIVVEDNPERSFALPGGVRHVSWKEIEADLGSDAWIIPRRSDAVRNYGFLLAAREKPDLIVTLDDDCYPSDAPGTPEENFLKAHWRMLETPGSDLPVLDTMFAAVLPVRPRGFPKIGRDVRTVVNHGLWNGVPDLDGETQLRNEGLRVTFPPHSVQVPSGVLFPMCGMNLSFRPEALPIAYYLPMGQGQPYHRFADIWCGWILKKVCDHLGWSVRSGPGRLEGPARPRRRREAYFFRPRDAKTRIAKTTMNTAIASRISRVIVICLAAEKNQSARE